MTWLGYPVGSVSSNVASIQNFSLTRTFTSSSTRSILCGNQIEHRYRYCYTMCYWNPSLKQSCLCQKFFDEKSTNYFKSMCKLIQIALLCFEFCKRRKKLHTERLLVHKTKNSLRAPTVQDLRHMSCTKFGLGQSANCPVQASDPSFAQPIHGSSAFSPTQP